MRVIAAVNYFCQGRGGAPESLRLLARGLSGIAEFDVLDESGFMGDVGSLGVLPKQREETSVPVDELYDLAMIVGPWQSPLRIHRMLRLLKNQAPVIYLPRGGLCNIEFVRFAKCIKAIPYLAFIESQILGKADVIVFSSSVEEQNINWLARRHFRRTQTIPDMVDTDSCNRVGNHTDPSMPLQIGMLAELHPRKGIDEGIAAYLRCRDGLSSDTRLLVAGGRHQSATRYVSNMLKKYGSFLTQEAIDFVGPIAHERRLAFYQSLDIFFAPTRFESFGLTIVEALSVGCVVVTTRNVGVTEWIPNSVENLLVAKSGSVSDIADALLIGMQRVAHNRNRISKTDRIDQINRTAYAEWNDLLSELGVLT